MKDNRILEDRFFHLGAGTHIFDEPCLFYDFKVKSDANWLYSIDTIPFYHVCAPKNVFDFWWGNL